MSKAKSPLLSLGARGTIGDALTYQKRGREHIVRQKPIPKDPYSLNQAYQRWDYRDYAYLWTLLSNSEKQVYRTKASRYHITGFSQWMRENLKDLTGIAGRWHLDEVAGAIAYDSSRNGNNGAIIGASPATGLIAGAHYFDGINDRVSIPHTPSLNLASTITIETFIYPTRIPQDFSQMLIIKGTTGPGQSYYLYMRAADNLIYFSISGAGNVTTPMPANMLNHWWYIVGTYDGAFLRIYLNGVLANSQAYIGPIVTNALPLMLGATSDLGLYFQGRQDNVIIHEPVLDPIEILRHSERRYP